MALFANLFERSHDPYSIPGARWYKMHFDPTDESVTGDLCPGTEIVAPVAGFGFRLPVGYKPLKAVTIRHGKYTGTSQTGPATLEFQTRGMTNSKFGIVVTISKSGFKSACPDGCDIYILCTKER